jgi:hypothetical protein
MCFANAVLQLLVRSPSFWNLFRKLGDLSLTEPSAGDLETGGPTPLALVLHLKRILYDVAADGIV